MKSLLQAHYEADKMRDQSPDHDWLASVLYDLYCAFSEEGTNQDQEARLAKMGMPQFASTQADQAQGAWPKPISEEEVLRSIGRDKSYLLKAPHVQKQLQARRSRLLERIQEAQDDVTRFFGNNDAQERLQELKEELAAVESALGYPEPKEPAEASDEAYDLKLKYCPSCLCLYEHEDPDQSCKCEPKTAMDVW